MDAGSLVQPGRQLESFEKVEELPGTLEIPKCAVMAGGYADIYCGLWITPQGERVEVAVKELRTLIPKDRRTKEEALKTKVDTRLRREIFNWSQTKHPNLHALLGYCSEPKPRLINAWCRHGNVTDYLQAYPELTRCDKLRLIYQAACGLEYLHSRVPPICHADIKPENVLISDYQEAALSDFGLSQVVQDLEDQSGYTNTETIKRPLRYMARELLIGRKPNLESDVYAFGGLILTVMSGNAPFNGLLPQLNLYRVLQDQPPIPKDHPSLPDYDSLWKLMRRCWDQDPLRGPRCGRLWSPQSDDELGSTFRRDPLDRPRHTGPGPVKPTLRTCRQCGEPGRYKDGKCVETWGPGPAGAGTVCEQCRKEMERVERRETQDAASPGQHLPLGLLTSNQQQPQLSNELSSTFRRDPLDQPRHTGPRPAVKPTLNAQGQRTCRQCGQPGRYKDGKCVEKWGPGPAGPGTICSRCCKKMQRVERRGTQYAGSLGQRDMPPPPGILPPQQHITDRQPRAKRRAPIYSPWPSPARVEGDARSSKSASQPRSAEDDAPASASNVGSSQQWKDSRDLMHWEQGSAAEVLEIALVGDDTDSDKEMEDALGEEEDAANAGSATGGPDSDQDSSRHSDAPPREFQFQTPLSAAWSTWGRGSKDRSTEGRHGRTGSITTSPTSQQPKSSQPASTKPHEKRRAPTYSPSLSLEVEEDARSSNFVSPGNAEFLYTRGEVAAPPRECQFQNPLSLASSTWVRGSKDWSTEGRHGRTGSVTTSPTSQQPEFSQPASTKPRKRRAPTYSHLPSPEADTSYS